VNKLEGERRVVTVLFADIRGFTTLSEKISLEELHGLINEYFRVMIEQVTAFEGVIDKFIGDKIMAVFSQGGAEGAVGAARAALGIQQAIRELNGTRSGAGAQAIEVGIGLNTGEVVMGTVGSEERMSFTVIGDSVNVADRFQSLASAGEIYLGEGTVKRLDDRFEVEELGARTIRGRQNPEKLFKLSAEKS
jgi:adenylate cyclase